MKSLRIALGVLCVAVVCGVAILWRAHKQHVIEQKKLSDKANANRIRAEKGDAEAQYALAYLYYQGQGVPQDYREAVRWARMAAEQGNAKAQFALGYAYREGRGVGQDYAEASRWYIKAADQGYAKAQTATGSLYYAGLGKVRNYEEAVRWYRKAADQGDAVAEYNLGCVYYRGKGISQDYTEAARWYRKSADQGDAGAQYTLAYMYYHGQAVGQDYVQAVRWFHKAADSGDAGAQYWVGYMYYEGEGVPQNQAEAVRWFRKAAKHGNLKAQAALRLSLSTPMKVFIGIDFLGILFLSFATYVEARKRLGLLQRAAIVRELLAVTYLALVFMSLSHVPVAYTNVFHLIMQFLRGMVVAMLIPVVYPKSEKFLLKLSLMLLLGVDLYAATRFNLRHPGAYSQLLYWLNVFLIGMAVPSAAVLWVVTRKEDHELNGQLRPHSSP